MKKAESMMKILHKVWKNLQSYLMNLTLIMIECWIHKKFLMLWKLSIQLQLKAGFTNWWEITIKTTMV